VELFPSWPKLLSPQRSTLPPAVTRTRGEAPNEHGGHAAREPRDLHRSHSAGHTTTTRRRRGVGPELAVGVAAPAFDAATRSDRASKVVHRGHGHGGHAAGEPGDLHRNGAVRRGVVPEPTVAVRAPAIHAPARGDRAVELDPHGHGSSRGLTGLVTGSRVPSTRDSGVWQNACTCDGNRKVFTGVRAFCNYLEGRTLRSDHLWKETDCPYSPRPTRRESAGRHTEVSVG